MDIILSNKSSSLQKNMSKFAPKKFYEIDFPLHTIKIALQI